jgi:UDP-N-acetylmuramoylalanine--D-glutamate ligase
VVLIGRDGPKIKSVLSHLDVQLIDAISMEDATAKAASAALAGDVVLLSPACASFDMFKNYVHRAEVYVQSVMKLNSIGESC